MSWLQGFDRVTLDVTTGRPYDDQSAPKILLHTTEGSSIEGAEAAYAGWPPHVGVEHRRRLRRQYLPLDRCSFALRGAESDDEFVVQVEIVGRAADPPSGAEAEWLGREVVGPIARAIGCPLEALDFYGPDSGIVLASPDSPIRLTAAQLRSYSGILGHQHAPRPDSHWDPGAIDIATILSAAQEDDMPLTDQDLHRIRDAARRGVGDAFADEDTRVFAGARRAAQLGTGDALHDPGHRAHQAVIEACRTGVKRQLNAALKSDTTPVGAKVAALVAGAVSEADLASEVVAELLRQRPDGRIDQATVEAGVRAVLSEGVG